MSLPTKQVRGLRVGDIILLDEEIRLITRISLNPRKSKPYCVRTVDLHEDFDGRSNLFDATVTVTVQAPQEREAT